MRRLTHAVSQNHSLANLQFKIAMADAEGRLRVVSLPAVGQPHERCSISCNTVIDDSKWTLDRVMESDDPSKVESWRIKAIKHLETLLRKDRLFKDMIKDQNDVSSEDDLTIEISYPLKRIELAEPKSLNLLLLCTQSEEITTAFVQHLEKASSEYIEEISILMVAVYDQLLFDKNGSRALKLLVRKSKTTQDLLSNYCMNKFPVVISNQSAYHVIKQLIQVNDDLRFYAFWFFEGNLNACLGNPTSVRLLLACMKAAKKPNEFNFLLSLLRKKPSLLSLTTFQKVLFVFSKRTSDESLAELGDIMDIGRNFRHYFNDRFTVHIIFTLLDRGVNPVANVLFRLIDLHSERLFCSRFFKLLLLKLYTAKVGIFSKELFSRIAQQMLISKITNTSQNSKDMLIFMLVALSDPLFAKVNHLKYLMAQIRHNDQVWQVLVECMKSKTGEAKPSPKGSSSLKTSS